MFLPAVFFIKNVSKYFIIIYVQNIIIENIKNENVPNY